MSGRDYKKERKEKRYYVLMSECNLLGLWSNLSKLCEDMKKENESFKSYHSLARMDKSQVMEFSDKNKKEYTLYVTTLKY